MATARGDKDAASWPQEIVFDHDATTVNHFGGFTVESLVPPHES